MHKQRAFHYSFIQQLMNCCNLIGWDVGSETSSVRRIAHCTQGTCERVRKGLAELLLFGLYRIDHFSISLKFSIKLVEKIVDYDITHSVHSGMWGRCADDRGRSGGLALVDFRCWLRCERCARTDLNNKLKLLFLMSVVDTDNLDSAHTACGGQVISRAAIHIPVLDEHQAQLGDGFRQLGILVIDVGPVDGLLLELLLGLGTVHLEHLHRQVFGDDAVGQLLYLLEKIICGSRALVLNRYATASLAVEDHTGGQWSVEHFDQGALHDVATICLFENVTQLVS